MRIIEIESRPRYHMLLAYAIACRALKITTIELDQRVADYAKREGISKVIAFEELCDIALDLECSRELREMAEVDEFIGY